MTVDRLVTGMDLPRSNGELVFAAPWQSRAFGLAVALHEQGNYSWQLFSQRLAEEIAGAENDGDDYYRHWLTALEQLVFDEGGISEADVARRASDIAAVEGHHHHHHGHA